MIMAVQVGKVVKAGKALAETVAHCAVVAIVVAVAIAIALAYARMEIERDNARFAILNSIFTGRGSVEEWFFDVAEAHARYLACGQTPRAIFYRVVLWLAKPSPPSP
jgi:hypothetical protein